MTLLNDYKALNRAQLSVNYLHSNSTTHEFLFGALAEMIDNSRDADAKNIHVYTEADANLRGGTMICFLDDGIGMSPRDVADVMTFGRSYKREGISNTIGQYGNGLKSGTMRVGNDFMLFSKTSDSPQTCLMLSRTFHEEEGIDEVIVPQPSFDCQSGASLCEDEDGKEKHELELALIYKYSPFKSHSELMTQFKKITTPSGTLLIVYSLKLRQNGETELDFNSAANDFRIPSGNPFDYPEDYSTTLHEERISFRRYLEIVYYPCRMQIKLQNEKICFVPLLHCLAYSREYTFSSHKFKTQAEAALKRAQHDQKVADERAREAESKSRDLQSRYGAMISDKAKRIELRQAAAVAESLRRKAKMLKTVVDSKSTSCREPKTLKMVFGVNIERRMQSGIFLYNQERLIKMYEAPLISKKENVSQADLHGVLGFLDIPYDILEPTHNKQDFADAREYRILLKIISDHMNQYIQDIQTIPELKSKDYFWKSMGYLSSSLEVMPSNEEIYLKKRKMLLPCMKQCSACLKYRKVPFQMSEIGEESREPWTCSLSADKKINSCSNAEIPLEFPKRYLKRPSLEDSSSKKPTKSSSNNEADEEEKEDEVVKRIPYVDKALANQSRLSPRNSAPLTSSAPLSRTSNPSFKSSHPIARQNSTVFPRAATMRKNLSQSSHAALKRKSEATSTKPSLKTYSASSLSHMSPSSRHSSRIKHQTSLSQISNGLVTNDKPSKVEVQNDDDVDFDSNSSDSAKMCEKLSKQMKILLKFCIPPNYSFKADDITHFSMRKLVELDLQDLRSKYEAEIKALITRESRKALQVQSDEVKKLEGEVRSYQAAAKAKDQEVQLLRRNIASLMNQTNPDIGILPDSDGPEVDEFIKQCLSMLDSKSSSAS